MLTEASRREMFPSLQEMTYLNSAAEGIPPLTVGTALQEYFRDKQRGMAGREQHGIEWQQVRELTAQMYGMTADDIGICSNSSEAYNLAALALNLQPGDEVVINDLDFPSGSTPWLQPNCPATVKVWRAREGALQVEDLAPLLSARTRLVTISMVSYNNGYTLSVPEVAQTIRQHSPALLSVDVTQALGRIPLNLKGADLVVSSTHKWILAPHGGGLVGVPKEREAEWTVPAGGWFNLESVFTQPAGDPVTSKPGAASFMVGMPNYPAIYGIRAGLQYIQSVGVEAIDQAARPLVHACLDGLAKLPVQVITPHEDEHLAGILAFRHPQMAEVHARLLAGNVHVMHSSGRMRIAIHGYNTAADVDALLRTLTDVLA